MRTWWPRSHESTEVKKLADAEVQFKWPKLKVEPKFNTNFYIHFELTIDTLNVTLNIF